MKVRKFGNKIAKVKDWELELTCQSVGNIAFVGCGAELTASLSDLYKIQTESGASVQVGYYCKCPTCHEDILIPYDQIPKDVEISKKPDWLKSARTDMIHSLFQMADTDAKKMEIKAACLNDIGIPETVLRDLGYME